MFRLLPHLAVALVVVLRSSGIGAHDLMTPAYADKYLAMATQYSLSLKSTEASLRRVESAYLLGRLQDELREYLYRDVATHGKLVRVASNDLVHGLKARGVPLAQNARGYFVAYPNYYHDALRIAPRGPLEADALYGLVQGYFYDSFDDDPRKPRSQSWRRLQDQIELCERLLGRPPACPEQEEVRFIIPIHYGQAARSPDSANLPRQSASMANSAALSH